MRDGRCVLHSPITSARLHHYRYEKAVTTMSSKSITHDDMSNFKKRHPPVFSGYYNPVGARKWVVEMETILDSIRCAERYKVMFATLTLVEKAENRWNLNKPLITNSWEHHFVGWVKARFLENYAPQDSSNQGAKGKQTVKGPGKVQRNKRKDDKKIQKPHAKFPEIARQPKTSLHSTPKECYHCKRQHLKRNYQLL